MSLSITTELSQYSGPRSPRPTAAGAPGGLPVTALLSLLFLTWAASSAVCATYYVALGGNDAHPGTQTQPWRTIGKAAATLVAGDTVLISPGDYDEHVHGTTSGAVGNPITYRAVPAHGASLRAFRLSGAHIVLDGLKLTRFAGVGNTWGAATRIEPSANNCVITNCVYADTPYVIAHDFRFLSAGNRIVSVGSDFTAAGFVPGSKIYLGAAGLDGLWYTNHDTLWIIASNTTSTLWVTNSAGGAFAPDAGSNYWAVIRPGSSTYGFYAINMIPIAGVAATNVVISGNLISNWMGNAISILGRGHVVENNRVTKLHSFRFLDFAGDNHVIRSNIIKDSPNILHYSTIDGATLVHPTGGGWYDYQVAMFSDPSPITHSTNILFAYNWFENLENQLGGVGDPGMNTHGITFHNNVFIGISAHFSGGRDDMRWISNTFYRCSFESGGPLAIGSRPPAQSGYVIRNNLFIDCGTYVGMAGKGFYSITTNALDPFVDFNMVAGPELTGYAPKVGFNESNGVNGGNPVFLNVLDPMGPDGIPFTADDGLQVLPNSPAAVLGGGACGVFQIPSDQPVAHFRITNPQGWFEPVGNDYDPAWLAQLPTTRGRLQRPYTTPPLLGAAPVTATFNASESLPGVDGPITQYVWSFNGLTVTTSGPTVTHPFGSGGTQTVRLMVRNSAGQTHSFSTLYRVTEAMTVRPAAPKSLQVVD